MDIKDPTCRRTLLLKSTDMHRRGLVPATSPYNLSREEFTRRDWSQGLVSRTVHTKGFEEQVEENCPQNSNQFEFLGLVARTKLWPLGLDFVAKKASSRDGT